MRKVDRTRLLVKIVNRLSEEDWQTTDLILGQFGGKREDRWEGDHKSYIGWSIENLDDKVLYELGEYFGFSHGVIINNNSKVSIIQDETLERIWGKNNKFRIFLSHISINKEFAASLQKTLEGYGISSFVAHSDIQPTKEWLEEIENALKTMNTLVAILDKGFHESHWTDQEVGYAIGRGILVISLKREIDPYGFIGKYQAINIATCTTEIIALNLVKTLLKNEISQVEVSEALVAKLSNSSAFEMSKNIISLLEIPQKLPESVLSIM